MASSINASTSGAGGVITTADSSGVLNIQTAGTTAVTVDASQNVAFAKGFTVGATAAPAFSAYQSSAQSVTANTFTKITFTTEEFDTNNNFASSRFTPTVAGYYQVSFSVTTAPPPGFFTMLYKNGVEYKLGSNLSGTSPNSYAGYGSVLAYMNGSTDYLEIYQYQFATQNIIASASQTYFQAAMIRSA
jgi:hypothetical protein